jgi:D-lactate dehydrogenase (cytochrome)
MADTCLGFLQKNTGMSFPACDSWVLLTAIEASCEKDLDTILETLYMLLEENGINADNTWGGFERAERKRLKEFRHLLPETVNRIIAGISAGNRRIHKISTDTAVPALQLQAYFREMRAILVDSGVEYVVFGHAGQGHLHANLIPVNNSQLQEAEQSVKLIAEKAVQAGGTISAEHGTGKLKNHLLELMYSRRELCEMDLLVEAITKC